MNAISPSAKRTVKNATVRPFALSNANAWRSIEYQHDPAEGWRNALASPFVVLPSTLQDVRRDANHAFQIVVDLEALRSDQLEPEKIDLLVVVRDNFSKDILTLYKQNLGASAELKLAVQREDLEATSLARRIDFEIMLVANSEVALRGRTIRRSARLAKHVVSVSTESQGIAFNYRKTTSAEFAAMDLPPGTSFHVKVDNPTDLVASCDDISSVLKVLVHEDAWSTLQEIKAGDQIGEALGTMLIADVLFDVLAMAVSADLDPSTIEEGSVLKRMLTWLANEREMSVDDVQADLLGPEGLYFTKAWIQDALKLTRSIKKVRLNEGELE